MEAHQEFRARAGGCTRLDAARGVRGGEEGLRPGRIVAVDETVLRAVDRKGLRVGGKAREADPEFLGLLDGALKERLAGADGQSDHAGKRARPGVARHPDCGLDFVEAELHGGGRISGQLQRVILGVGDMGLVAGLAAGPQLRLGKSQFQEIEMAENLCKLRRRHALGEAHETSPRHVDVDQVPREAQAVHRHRFLGDTKVEVIVGDEFVDQIEVRPEPAIHLNNESVADDEGRRRIGRALRHAESIVWILGGELVLSKRALVPEIESAPAVRAWRKCGGDFWCRARLCRHDGRPCGLEARRGCRAAQVICADARSAPRSTGHSSGPQIASLQSRQIVYF